MPAKFFCLLSFSFARKFPVIAGTDKDGLSIRSWTVLRRIGKPRIHPNPNRNYSSHPEFGIPKLELETPKIRARTRIHTCIPIQGPFRKQKNHIRRKTKLKFTALKSSTFSQVHEFHCHQANHYSVYKFMPLIFRTEYLLLVYGKLHDSLMLHGNLILK